MATSRNPNSIETVLTYYDNKDVQSEWSEVVSTTHIPGMDNASGGGAGGARGRRRLQLGALAVGGFLTMHCRVAASALTGGFFIFLIFLIIATALLANPLRHFEVYLGQWSISGPGRAFRILPLFEGIGIAICINALVRAIVCCTVAAITAVYVVHSVSDAKLPYGYCRNFDLKPYEPILKEITLLMLRETRFSVTTGDLPEEDIMNEHATVGTREFAWRTTTHPNTKKTRPIKKFTRRSYNQKIEICNENYSIGYPSLYSTPAYNFFYVEVVLFREDFARNFGQLNLPLMLCVVVVWAILWILLIVERFTHGRLIWNNIYSWLVVLPWIWTVLLLVAAVVHIISMPKALRRVYRIGAKEVLAGIADALEVALYIHSASVGTEIIHGKGLNHYASGHIDPHLNGENILHSGLLLLLAGLHSAGAAMCALVDSIQPNTKSVYNMQESTLWIIPLYSSCTKISKYSHLMSVLTFGGLTFSYMTSAYFLIKTALHTIFEYNVKLVFAEQAIVAGIILSCMGLSLLFTTSGGVGMLESVDAVMSGLSMPFLCLLELVALLYFYRSHDFISDMNISTEENACSTRIGTQWQIIPLIVLGTLLIKLVVIWNAEMPRELMWGACAPLAAVVLAPVIRGVRNICTFLRRPKLTS